MLHGTRTLTHLHAWRDVVSNCVALLYCRDAGGRMEIVDSYILEYIWR